MRSATLLCCPMLVASVAASADEATRAKEAARAEAEAEESKQSRIVNGLARRSAEQTSEVELGDVGRAWETDAVLAYALLNGQPQTDSYEGGGLGAALGGHLMIWPWVGVEAEALYLTFNGLSGRSSGNAFLPAAGLRFDPRPGLDWGGYYLAAHAGEAFTGGIERFAFDVGAGVEWDFGGWRMGPTVRYVDVTAAPSAHQLGGDAHVFLLGLSIGLCSKRPEITIRGPEARGKMVVHHRLGSLTGRVTDPDGKPLQARLLVSPLDDGDAESLAADPTFEIRLGEGGYHLEASAPGYQPARREVFVEAGEELESNFLLQPLNRAPLAVLTPTEIAVTQTIEFELKSAQLRPDAQPILLEVAGILRQHPELRIRIEGHTDDWGDEAYNLSLSGARAESVRSFLYGAGIRADRLEARGYGLTRPLAPNTSEEGRAKNRRVQFKILGLEGDTP